MALSDLSIRRPVATTMLYLAVGVLGVVSFARLPIDLLPKVEFTQLTVRVDYPNVGPEEVEQIITDRIENAVAGLPNLERVTSQSEEGQSSVRLEFARRTNIDEAANDLRAAVGLRVAVGAIVESLVFEAVEALSEGDSGRVTIETANLEIAHRDPDVIPAVVPTHYVTIAVTAAGNGVAAENFTRAFEPDPAAAATAKRRGHDRLMTPAAIYRLLQRCGGDLSLEVEPGMGSTFTIFLPLASEHGVAVRAAPAAPARRS